MDKELNVARVLKQLVYILEENDFVLYYDKRFKSSAPQIDGEHDYLYHNFLDNPYSPLTYCISATVNQRSTIIRLPGCVHSHSTLFEIPLPDAPKPI